MKKMSFEGDVAIEMNDIVCVCGHCGNHDNANARIEFNFREKKVFYLCSECKKINEIQFGLQTTPPLPKTSIGR